MPRGDMMIYINKEPAFQNDNGDNDIMAVRQTVGKRGSVKD